MEFEDWKVKKLSDTEIAILDGDRGKNYPNKLELITSGYCLFLSNKNLHDDKLNVNFGDYISQEKDEVLRNGKLIRGDIIMSTRGSVGNIGYYHEEIPLDNIRINSGMVIFRNNDEQILNGYLYYLLKSPFSKNQYIELTSGSVQNQLPIRDLKRLEVLIPPISKQIEIISVLGAIERKMENNQIINSNLEQLAQTLFKRWFVDFEFPNENGDPYKSSGGEMVESELGMIPAGWKIDDLKQIIQQGGKSIKVDDLEESVPYIGLEHMPRGSIALTEWETSDKVTSNKTSFAEKDILFGKLRPYFKKVGIAPLNGICSTDILVLKAKINAYYTYLVCLVSHESFINYCTSTATGTRMPRTGWKQISSYRIATPPEEIVNKFNSLIQPYFNYLNASIYEKKNLTELRDILLPKLLSGEIELPDETEVTDNVPIS